MKESKLQKAAARFGKGIATVTPLGDGLIHHSYHAKYTDSKPVVLQCINRTAFLQPENIIHNYQLLTIAIADSKGATKIPALQQTAQNKFFWIDEDDDFWRATEYIENSFSPAVLSRPDQAYEAAKCFADLTKDLTSVDMEKMEVIIPDFHNIETRYLQFEDSIKKAHISRLLKATHVISEMRDRSALRAKYQEIAASDLFLTRVMHHDCKINNVLFEKDTNKAICAVDLDTTMPGKFFSDLGDMVRTMACTVDENSVAWEDIDVKKDFYNAILHGYLSGLGEQLTDVEKENIQFAGQLVTYMQCLRYVTDFLNNDTYYRTKYPEQNLNRALNQLILLEKLEEFKAG
ncbi:MAG: phosphotransferase [Gemmatimonadaceae bacterium]|nr:phosphotransferase [Chitinophagaceae bacterium]